MSRDAALAILDCEQWKNALRNCTTEGNKMTTPMRKLIKKLPGTTTPPLMYFPFQSLVN